MSALMIVATTSTATGQSADWESVHQSATWLNASADHALSSRTAFWFDAHWRRMGIGAEPQQVLLRPGVQLLLPIGLRLGAGYAYIATAPYGQVPSAAPTREHRAWQQLSWGHAAGETSVSHRVRWEQRWSAPLTGDQLAPLGYQQRARYALRLQRPLSALRPGGRPTYAALYDEFFLPVGHSDGRTRRLQNRVGVAIGYALDDRQQIELGYMHQWNRVTPARTHEINHTIVVSWSWTYER